MPAPDIETTVREISRNVARMAMCMWVPSLSRVLYLEHASRVKQLQIVQRRVGEDIPGVLTPAFVPGFAVFPVCRRDQASQALGVESENPPGGGAVVGEMIP